MSYMKWLAAHLCNMSQAFSLAEHTAPDWKEQLAWVSPQLLEPKCTTNSQEVIVHMNTGKPKIKKKNSNEK